MDKSIKKQLLLWMLALGISSLPAVADDGIAPNWQFHPQIADPGMGITLPEGAKTVTITSEDYLTRGDDVKLTPSDSNKKLNDYFAKQQQDIEDLKKEVADLKEQLKKADSHKPKRRLASFLGETLGGVCMIGASTGLLGHSDGYNPYLISPAAYNQPRITTGSITPLPYTGGYSVNANSW